MVLTAIPLIFYFVYAAKALKFGLV